MRTTQSPNMLRVGVVGAGNIATIAQLPTLVTRDDVALVALVDRRDDAPVIQRRWGFEAVFPNLEAALDTADLDVVFVLTPRHAHAAAVRLAIERGVDVFCEKPLAVAAEEAHQLADLAESHERILMVGFNRRFAPVYKAGREAFGAEGSSFCVAQKNRAGSEYRATFENAIHMVDLLRWYCGGEPTAVHATATGDDPWQEDGLSAFIAFSTGNTGVLVAARNAGTWHEKLDAYGQQRSVEIDAPDRIRLTHNGATTIREMSPEAFGWATATQTFGFAAEVHHFLSRVRDRAQPLTCGREAANTQSLLERILAAAELPLTEQEGREWTSHATG